MATKVYEEEEIELQDGSVVKLKPLNIKRLRKFMEIIKKLEESEDEVDSLDVMVEACAIAVEPSNPELAADRDKLEEALDMAAIHKILEVCGGVKMDDPNLAAAVELVGRT